jgi:uncharacterized phiE125 gp8 family phage protein
MSLFLATAPTVEPVTLEEAKLHLRVSHDSEDALIERLIVSAREHVELITGRAVMRQTWDQKADGFPCWSQPIWIEKPPCSSITSISYVDTNGDTQTWSSALYTTDLPTGPHARMGRVVPAYLQTYPQTRCVQNAVTVRFVAGYGTSPSAVPSAIKSAIHMLVGHWYATRESVIVGVSASAVPQSVDALLWPFRVFA